MSDPWASVVPSVATSLVTTLLVVGGGKGSKSLLNRRKYAFSLAPGFARVWYLKKLHGPAATDVSYRIVDENLVEKQDLLQHSRIEPSGGYGIWNLEVGDTFEIYWWERKKQHSTFQKVFPDQRDYLLRRENTGH